jgi:3-hydroxyisobutyrate dehydrogenase
VIDCATIAAASARKVADAAKGRGLAFVYAPVSGGTGGATGGTLTFIVGGEVAAIERARPLLLAMGKNIFRAGAAVPAKLPKL